jgi:hypothetical protein
MSARRSLDLDPAVRGGREAPQHVRGVHRARGPLQVLADPRVQRVAEVERELVGHQPGELILGRDRRLAGPRRGDLLSELHRFEGGQVLDGRKEPRGGHPARGRRHARKVDGVLERDEGS